MRPVHTVVSFPIRTGPAPVTICEVISVTASPFSEPEPVMTCRQPMVRLIYGLGAGFAKFAGSKFGPPGSAVAIDPTKTTAAPEITDLNIGIVTLIAQRPGLIAPKAGHDLGGLKIRLMTERCLYRK